MRHGTVPLVVGTEMPTQMRGGLLPVVCRMHVQHVVRLHSVRCMRQLHGVRCMASVAWRPLHGVRCMASVAWRPLHGVSCMVSVARWLLSSWLLRGGGIRCIPSLTRLCDAVEEADDARAAARHAELLVRRVDDRRAPAPCVCMCACTPRLHRLGGCVSTRAPS
jgi:hypothetical protein